MRARLIRPMWPKGHYCNFLAVGLPLDGLAGVSIHVRPDHCVPLVAIFLLFVALLGGKICCDTYLPDRVWLS